MSFSKLGSVPLCIFFNDAPLARADFRVLPLIFLLPKGKNSVSSPCA
jgi:hypothetical protein